MAVVQRAHEALDSLKQGLHLEMLGPADADPCLGAGRVLSQIGYPSIAFHRSLFNAARKHFAKTKVSRHCWLFSFCQSTLPLDADQLALEVGVVVSALPDDVLHESLNSLSKLGLELCGFCAYSSSPVLQHDDAVEFFKCHDASRGFCNVMLVLTAAEIRSLANELFPCWYLMRPPSYNLDGGNFRKLFCEGRGDEIGETENLTLFGMFET